MKLLQDEVDGISDGRSQNCRTAHLINAFLENEDSVFGIRQGLIFCGMIPDNENALYLEIVMNVKTRATLAYLLSADCAASCEEEETASCQPPRVHFWPTALLEIYDPSVSLHGNPFRLLAVSHNGKMTELLRLSNCYAIVFEINNNNIILRHSQIKIRCFVCGRG